MKWKELKELWQKEKTYTKEVTFICHMVRRGASKDSIASFYDLDSVKELNAFAKNDFNVMSALNKENIAAHKDFHDECYKYYKGFEYEEPVQVDEVDSTGHQSRVIKYIKKKYIPTLKDREYYGKKFVDEYYTDQKEMMDLKGTVIEKGRITCLKPKKKKLK